MVDGRDVEALCQVFWQAAQVKGKPTAVVAKTFKGRGMPSKYFLLTTHVAARPWSVWLNRQPSGSASQASAVLGGQHPS